MHQDISSMLNIIKKDKNINSNSNTNMNMNSNMNMNKRCRIDQIVNLSESIDDATMIIYDRSRSRSR